jgi:hypothetical protein
MASQAGTCRYGNEPTFEVVAGLIDISGDAVHGDGCGDDHVCQFGEQVVATAADALAGVYLLTELRGSSSQFRRHGPV